ncbi:MAG: hypothetical protein ABIR96_05985 [Bdellovibrionota bacterium]
MKVQTKNLLLLSFLASQATYSLPTVDWKVLSLSNTRKDDLYIACEYPNALRERPAKRDGDPATPTMNFQLTPNDLSDKEKGICENSLTNLMGLDEVRLRDEIAKKLSKLPCDKVKVVTEAQQDPGLKAIYPNARNLWKTQHLEIKTCLKETPDFCKIPVGSDQGSPSTILSYDSIARTVDMCISDVEAAITAGAELNAWKQQNDPNKKKPSSAEEHQNL